MKRHPVRLRSAASALVAAAVLPACETDFVTIAPEVSTQSEVIGHVQGNSYRHLLLGTPSYNLIPIGWSGCTTRACEEALAAAPEGEGVALRNVTVREDWFWWVLGSAREFNIEGDVVRK
jgi:hypothetical protein